MAATGGAQLAPTPQDDEARLAALAELQVMDTPPEERFDRVTRLCSRLFGVPMAMVSLVDRDRLWVKSGVGVPFDELPRSDAFCNVAIQQREPLVVADTLVDERFATSEMVLDDPRIRFYAGQPLESRGGHRLGTLCILDDRPRHLSPLELDLLRDLALWVQNELVVDEELERAAAVQRGLLPRKAPAVEGYDIAGECVPSWSVSGDFFDWYPSGAGLVVTLADVMGKGIASAILMATVRAVLRGATRTDGIRGAIERADLALVEDLGETGSFVTVFHAHLDPPTGTVRYVDAGHGLALVARAGGAVERLAAAGLPMGLLPDQRWEEGCTELQPGDALVAVSDGVLDLHGGGLDDAQIDAACTAIATTVRGAPTAAAAVGAITFGTRALPDDLTIVVIRRG